MFSYENCEIFKSIYFEELGAAASVSLVNKNKFVEFLPCTKVIRNVNCHFWSILRVTTL